jgi:hypothetical protein
MPKQGMIYSLEKVLAKLLDGQKDLSRRLGRVERKVAKQAGGRGATVRKKPGRKPGRKAKVRRGPRKKPGPKPKHKVCKVRGCNKPHYAKGYCLSHYQKMLREKKKPRGKKKVGRRGRPPKKAG